MFSARYPSFNEMPFSWRNVDIGGYTFSSDPVTLNPRSFSAAATDAMAVPQLPRKGNFFGASFTRILYAAQRISPAKRKRASSRAERGTSQKRARFLVTSRGTHGMGCTFARFFAPKAFGAQDDKMRSAAITSSQTPPPRPTLHPAGPVRTRARDPDTFWPRDRPDKIPGTAKIESWLQ